MNTFMANSAAADRKWYLIDAAGKTLGRLAAETAKILRGKHKPIFTPHADIGDYVIIINAEKIILTGKKLTQKTYFRHSGYPGGTSFTVAGKMLTAQPTRVLELAIKGMLPKNRLGRKMYTNLNVYAGAEHPHTAQKPELLELDIR